MKFVTALIAVTVLLSANAFPAEEVPGTLRFTAVSDKEVYGIDEEILIELKLENTGTEEILVNTVMASAGNLEYEIKDEDGNVVMKEPPERKFLTYTGNVL